MTLGFENRKIHLRFCPSSLWNYKTRRAVTSTIHPLAIPPPRQYISPTLPPLLFLPVYLFYTGSYPLLCFTPCFASFTTLRSETVINSQNIYSLPLYAFWTHIYILVTFFNIFSSHFTLISFPISIIKKAELKSGKYF